MCFRTKEIGIQISAMALISGYLVSVSLIMTYCLLSGSVCTFAPFLNCLFSSKGRKVITSALMSVPRRWWQKNGLKDTRIWSWALKAPAGCPPPWSPFKNRLLSQQVCLGPHRRNSLASVRCWLTQSSPPPSQVAPLCISLFLLMSLCSLSSRILASPPLLVGTQSICKHIRELVIIFLYIF